MNRLPLSLSLDELTDLAAVTLDHHDLAGARKAMIEFLDRAIDPVALASMTATPIDDAWAPVLEMLSDGAIVIVVDRVIDRVGDPDRRKAWWAARKDRLDELSERVVARKADRKAARKARQVEG